MEENNKPLFLKRKKEDLKNVTGKIIPVCMVIDVSYSMGLTSDDRPRSRMSRLNEGVELFIDTLMRDPLKRDNVELSIVLFGNDAEVALEYTQLSKIKNLALGYKKKNFIEDSIKYVQIFSSMESGNTAKGVDCALQGIMEEKEALANSKKRVSRPWLAIFSDGCASTPGTNKHIANEIKKLGRYMENVQNRVKNMELDKKINVIPVLIAEKDSGKYNDYFTEMQGFSDRHELVELGEDGDAFKNFFNTFSESVGYGNKFVEKTPKKADNDVDMSTGDVEKVDIVKYDVMEEDDDSTYDENEQIVDAYENDDNEQIVDAYEDDDNEQIADTYEDDNTDDYSEDDENYESDDGDEVAQAVYDDSEYLKSMQKIEVPKVTYTPNKTITIKVDNDEQHQDIIIEDDNVECEEYINKILNNITDWDNI